MNNQGNQYQGFQGEIPALPVFQTEVAQETLQPPPGTPINPPGTPSRPGTPVNPFNQSYAPPFSQTHGLYTETAIPVPVMTSALRSNGKEIRINNPAEFDGNREHLNSFLQDCHLYLALNHETYDGEEKKIIFILSYMTKGTAKAWKEAFIQKIMDSSTQNFGTYKDFLAKVHKAFAAADIEGDARAALRQLRQGNGTVDEYNSQFRIIAGRAKITDDTALIEYYMEGLNAGTLSKIFAQSTIPKKIDEWYEQASKYDAQFRRIKEILARRRGASTATTTQTKRTFAPRYTNTSQKDPNAMDVDRLTVEEREKHMKENRCFNCHKIGHRSRNCRQKNPGSTSKIETVNELKQNNERSLIRYEGKKMANTARALIRNLVGDMEKEEKDKLFEDILEDQDF